MKKAALPLIVLGLTLAGCSPQIHVDVLGQDRLGEVVLVPSRSQAKILMIDVEGMISSSPSPGLFSREKNVISRVFERLERAALDPRVRAVILRLDTPGGEVTASDIIYHEVLKFRERTGKPVVGLMMGIAASGGYYIASACDHIMAHPSTLTGSIGVISIFPNFRDLMAKVGVAVTVVKSGESKDSGSPFRAMTEEEKKVFQAVIDEYYQEFLDVVASNRKEKIPAAELRAIADGRVYTAPQALRLHLIDEIGYFENAYKKALSLAGLREAKVVAYTYFPKSQTNIYAERLADSPSLESKAVEASLGLLKAGFYYLWLPQSRP